MRLISALCGLVFFASHALADTCTNASPGSCVTQDDGVRRATPTLGSASQDASITMFRGAQAVKIQPSSPAGGITVTLPSASGTLLATGTAVTNAQLANMAAGTLKCNPAGSSAAPQDCWSGVSNNVEAQGMQGIDGGFFMDFQTVSSIGASSGTAGTFPSIRAQREVTGGTGTTAFVIPTIWGLTHSLSTTENAYEWTILGENHNQINASANGQPVGIQGSIFKETPTSASVIFPTTATSGTGTVVTITFSGGATIPVGHSVNVAGVAPSGYNGVYKVTVSSAGSVSYAGTTTGTQSVAGTIVDTSVGSSWGGNTVCTDNTSEPDPVASCIGMEAGTQINSATTDANKQRFPITANANGTSGSHVAGLFGGFTGTGVVADNLLYAPATLTNGINLSGATISNSAMWIPDNSKIIMDTAGFRNLHYAGGSLAYDGFGQVSAFTITDVGAGAFITSVGAPIVLGGTGASASLTIESTSGAGTTDFIAFKTASQSERMRILNSGGVAIGNTTDAGAGGLDVNGQIYAPNMGTLAATTTAYVCFTSGTSPAGQLRQDSTTCLASLREWKRDWEPLKLATPMLLKLKPSTYFWKQPQDTNQLGQQIGMIAEDVEAADKRLASYDGDAKLHGWREDAVVSLLVKGFQELKADNDNLRHEIQQLKRAMR